VIATTTDHPKEIYLFNWHNVIESRMYLNYVIESRQKNLKIVVCENSSLCYWAKLKRDRLILKKWAYPSLKNGGWKFSVFFLSREKKFLVPNRYIPSFVYVTHETYLPCCVNFVYSGYLPCCVNFVYFG